MHDLLIRIVVVLACIGFARSVAAQSREDSAVATPRRSYPAGSIHRFLLGDHYRELWSLEITAPVLNLETYAGGLTPTGLGGGLQTRSVRFLGADGRRYTFRAIDKDATRTLDPDLRQTIAASVLQDQISALLPGSSMIVSDLLEAAGVLHAEPELFVMPSDPKLGEYLAEFGGLLGFMEERPDEGPDGEPGFAGARWVINSGRLMDSLESSPRHVFDDRAFARARLLDAFVGDWDRHPDQWLWAGFAEAERTRWVPIPRDRDWALARLDGFLVWIAGFAFPNYKGFDDEFPSAFRLSWTGRALDRTLLSALPLPVWDSIASDLVSRLDDDVIAAAVRNLPPAYHDRVGGRIEHGLRMRRDALSAYAREYYRLLAGWVDVHVTDADEIADIERIDGDRVTVNVRRRDGDTGIGDPHYTRTFDAGATHEIRLFLHGGDDHVLVHGAGSGRITIRVIGGGADDTMIDRTGGNGVYFYDERGGNTFETGPGTHVDESEFVQRQAPGSGTAQANARDWGAWWFPVPYIAYEPGAGLYLGGGATRYGYGFRYFPWKTRLSVSAGYGTGPAGFRGSLSYDFPLHGELRGRLDVIGSGVDGDNFFGFGNETEKEGKSRFYRADRWNTTVSFRAAIQPVPSLDLSFGPVYRGSRPFRLEGTLLDSLDIYGKGDFDQLGVSAGLFLDRRNRTAGASRGFSIRLDGRFFPAALDVETPFGAAAAVASAFLSPDTADGPVLAFRAGGEKVWGGAPFREAAYLGGPATLRGFSNRRFAGSASVYGSTELRVPVTDVFITLPARLGLFGLIDGGRIFQHGESSDRWHAAAGGGLFLSALGPANVLSLALASSGEGTGVYLRAGFAY